MAQRGISTRQINWLLHQKHKGKETSSFYADIARLHKGEPLSYVIGFSHFLSAHIDLFQKPFIPELETEWFLEKKINEIRNLRKKHIKILDLFSGSGCIGISLAQAFEKAKVFCADKYPEALLQIKRNIIINRLSPRRVHVMRSDVFSHIHDRYHYIFANPPYIAFHRKKFVEKKVYRWFPHQSLFTKDNGLFFIKKLIIEGPRYLTRDGALFIEFDSWQKQKIESFLKTNGIRDFLFEKDQFGRPRFLTVYTK